jgi:hypothetical protein
MVARPAILAILTAAGSAAADVVALGASADAFVAASNPASNYGGAGAIAAASATLPNGEFQGFIRFDTFAAKQAFDFSFGANHWDIQSVTLQLSSTNAGNPLFNAAGAGRFTISWIANDSWIEGIGSPNEPGDTGVTFNDVPGLLALGEEDLGTFDYDGITGVTTVRTLTPSPSFLAELHAGSIVTLRLRAASPDVALLVNSRSFHLPENQPVFRIDAAASTACYANCDNSTAQPVLNANDFQCFLNLFAQASSLANCDGSTQAPTLNANDFQCFLNAFATGCN